MDFGENINIPERITPAAICRDLTKEEVKEIVINLGAEKCIETDRAYIFPTICHNPIGDEASMKLYYYFDRKIFCCFTDCQDKFNLFNLIVRVLTLNGHEDTAISDAYAILLSKRAEILDKEENYRSVAAVYKKKLGEQKQKEYPSSILDSFYSWYPPEWIQENISEQTMKKFNICFSIKNNAIVIPHYDIHNRLIGIRGRFLDYSPEKDLPKYMPLKIEQTIYSHQLSFNLYGLNNSLAAIQKSRKAVIFESEKSVLKSYQYYGEDSIAIACCGSNITKLQVDLLVKYGRINELIIALDKEYEITSSEKGHKYFNKLYSLSEKFLNSTNVSFIYDTEGLLLEKDAPIDKGKEIYEHLMKKRIRVTERYEI